MPFAEINGARLFYKVVGNRGPAIMFLHGGPGLTDHRGEMGAFEALSDAYTLVFYDARGSGQSTGFETYSHAQFAADAEGLRQYLGFAKMALYGGSYGGHIALEYAIRYQQHLSHLILRGTHASSKYDVNAYEIAFRRGVPGMSNDEMKPLLDRMTLGQVYNDDDYRYIYLKLLPLYVAGEIDAADAAAKAAAMPIRSETHNRVMQQCSLTYDIVDQIGIIRVPTLITVGRHDWICPVEGSEEMHRLIPTSQLVIFEQSGHGCQNEEHDKYLALMRQFLADPKGGRMTYA